MLAIDKAYMDTCAHITHMHTETWLESHENAHLVPSPFTYSPSHHQGNHCCFKAQLLQLLGFYLTRQTDQQSPGVPLTVSPLLRVQACAIMWLYTGFGDCVPVLTKARQALYWQPSPQPFLGCNIVFWPLMEIFDPVEGTNQELFSFAWLSLTSSFSFYLSCWWYWKRKSLALVACWYCNIIRIPHYQGPLCES